MTEPTTEKLARALEAILAIPREMVQRARDGYEDWLPVPSFELLYEVSSQGRVRSLPRTTTRGRILKPGRTPPLGHLYVNLYSGGSATRKYIHQLVMLAFVGPCPDGQEVRHLDGAPANNALWNLAYGTRTQNQLDTVRYGGNANSAKTHCPQNHEYTPENTYIAPSRRGRACRTCRRDQGRVRSQARPPRRRQKVQS